MPFLADAAGPCGELLDAWPNKFGVDNNNNVLQRHSTKARGMDLEAFHLQTAQLRWNAHYAALEQCVAHLQASTEHGFAPLSSLRLLEVKLDRSVLSGDRQMALLALAEAELVEAAVRPSNAAVRGASALKRWWTGETQALAEHLKLAVYGFACLLKGLLQVQTGSKLQGFLSFGRAQSAFEKLPELPTKPGEPFEAVLVRESKLCGVGAFMLLLSFLPSRLVGFLELVGYAADRERGTQMLELCAASGVFGREMARGVLTLGALIRSRFEPAKQAEWVQVALGHVLFLREEWPNNPHSAWLHSQICRMSGQLDTAIEAMQHTLECSRELSDQGLPLNRVTKELGWCYMIALRWSECAEIMWPIASCDSPDNMLRLWGLMLCIVSCWMLGQHDKLAELWPWAEEASAHNEFDEQLKRKLLSARHRSSGQLLAGEMLYHLNRFTGTMHPEWQQQVLGMLEQAEAADMVSPTELAISGTLRAALQMSSSEYSEHGLVREQALAALDGLSGLDKQEGWLGPNLHLVVANCALKTDDPKEAVGLAQGPEGLGPGGRCATSGWHRRRPVMCLRIR